MLELFTPVSKVQKDRQVMHDTDARVAKYSRRGLVLNFCVFALALVFGQFFHQQTTLAIILLTGLMLVTLLRSYYLFRFEVLYARAPRRWRTQYFIASFIGAIWWSVILVSLTWVQGMRDETLVMWLYTVVFYSSIANVFAPYFRFLKIYLFIGQIPAAVTAILLGTADGALYGIIMLLFYLMLVHQARVTSSTYWERLEANYVLHERARGLEYEQRSSRAAIELKNEFLVNLGHEFRSSLNDILGTLSLIDDAHLSDRQRELLATAAKAGERQLDLVNNVVDFSRITTRSLALDESVFDLRRLISKLIKDFSLEAHQQGVELNYLLADQLPLRVKGDAARLRQISASLLAHAIKFSVSGNIFVDVVFSEDDDAGELQIVISDSSENRSDDSRADSEDVRLQEAEQTGKVGIGLAISKGLAECMGGSVHMRKTTSGGNRMVINVAVQAISHQGKKLGADQRLKNKQVLLVDLPDRVAMDLVDELNNWGMQALPVYGYQQALDKIVDLQAQSQAVDMVVIYNRLNSFDALALSRELATQSKTQNILQLIAMSILQRDTDEVHEHLQRFPQVGCIEKPIMYKQLYDVFCARLLGDALPDALGVDERDESDDMEAETTGASKRRVLVVESHRVNQMVASGMLKKLGFLVYIVTSATEALAAIEKDKFDLALLDSDLSVDAAREAIEKIRGYEKNANIRAPLPIMAMTQHLSEADYNQLLALGFNDYVEKPLRFEDLENRLNRWLEKA